MLSDVIDVLEGTSFSIEDVAVRDPFDEAPKTYPMLVVYEIANLPKNYGTVNGETRTVLSYQVDIFTENCLDSSDTMLNRYEAGMRLAGEVSDALEAEFKMVRRSVVHDRHDSDTIRTIWRGDCVLDSRGYSYRN